MKTFFTILNVKYVPELATYLDDVGAEIVEDLKNLDDSDWDEIKSILRLKKLQERKLNAAIKDLNLEEYDHKIAPPLPKDAYNDNCGNMKKSNQEKATSSSFTHLDSMNGGNLPKIDKFLLGTKKSLTSDVSSATNSSVDESNSTGTIRGLIEYPIAQWREHRSREDPAEYITSLNDVAPYHKKRLWDLNLIKDKKEIFTRADYINFIKKTNDIEDFLGLYQVLGNTFSRETPP